MTVAPGGHRNRKLPIQAAIEGEIWLLTLRGDSGVEVLPKLTVAIDHLVKLGAEPTANNCFWTLAISRGEHPRM